MIGITIQVSATASSISRRWINGVNLVETMAQNTWQNIPYEQMVRNLFKPMEKPSDMLIHACIGIAGEAIELVNADDVNNFVEEAGDIEFYIEALSQTISPLELAMVTSGGKHTVGELHQLIVLTSGEIMDLGKKHWAYNKPLDKKNIEVQLILLRNYIGDLYTYMGLERAFVRLKNKEKLIGPNGRYRDQIYSDSAAIARADKDLGARSFIGQQKP